MSTSVSLPHTTAGPTRGSTPRRSPSRRSPIAVRSGCSSRACGTLNHLLLADRIWLKRLIGEGEHPDRLDAILYDDRLELAAARAAEDQRIQRVVGGFDQAAYARKVVYRTTEILMHLFNHQTHHRGQAHACLSIVAESEPPSLDLLALQRGAPAPDLAVLAKGSG